MNQQKILIMGVAALFLLAFGMVFLEYQFNTKPINQECRDYGYDGAFHSNRGWYCSKTIQGFDMAISYDDLKESSDIMPKRGVPQEGEQ